MSVRHPRCCAVRTPFRGDERLHRLGVGRRLCGGSQQRRAGRWSDARSGARGPDALDGRAANAGREPGSGPTHPPGRRRPRDHRLRDEGQERRRGRGAIRDHAPADVPRQRVRDDATRGRGYRRCRRAIAVRSGGADPPPRRCDRDARHLRRGHLRRHERPGRRRGTHPSPADRWPRHAGTTREAFRPTCAPGHAHPVGWSIGCLRRLWLRPHQIPAGRRSTGGSGARGRPTRSSTSTGPCETRRNPADCGRRTTRVTICTRTPPATERWPEPSPLRSLARRPC